MYAQHKQNTGVLTNTSTLQATVRSPPWKGASADTDKLKFFIKLCRLHILRESDFDEACFQRFLLLSLGVWRKKSVWPFQLFILRTPNRPDHPDSQRTTASWGLWLYGCAASTHPCWVYYMVPIANMFCVMFDKYFQVSVSIFLLLYTSTTLHFGGHFGGQPLLSAFIW